MLNTNLQLLTYFQNLFGLGILLLNIFIYIILLFCFFNVFFFFNFNFFFSLNTFKFFNITNFINVTIILIFLSLAGMPPFLGFVGKFLLISYLILKNQFFFFLLFLFVNLFVIYFYIQNLKFLIRESQENFFLNLNSSLYISSYQVNLLIFLLFFNFFGIFFFDNFIIYFLNFVIF
jgi:NADH-quinone oxidoreductase subunit N